MRKRSKYRPKYNPLACMNAVAWSRPFEEGETLDMLIRGRAALDELMTGGASLARTEYLAMVINTTIVRAEQIDPALIGQVEPGAQAIIRALDRHRRGLSLSLDADGRQSLPAALDVYEAILQASSPKQMDSALREAFRRISGGRVLRMRPVPEAA